MPDSVLVLGDASFGGGNSQLVAGTLVLEGDLSESGDTSSYAASGTHRTVLRGARLQRVSFASPGASSSRFHDLEVRNADSAGIQLASPVVANGALLTPFGGSYRRVYGNGNTLTVRGLDADSLILDNAPLVVETGAAITRFDTIVFRNFGDAATQLRVRRNAGEAYTFNNLTFSLTPPTTGFYVVADQVGGTGSPFTITLTNTTPSSPSGRTATSGGAVINWQ
jgi:hypothetical protein